MKIVTRWIAPLVVAVMMSGPAFAAAGLQTTRPVPAQTTSAPARVETSTTSTATESQSYAEREKQATGLENFQGGASIVIGGSAIALALLLVILLVLL
jgi:hypothetical protein